MTNKNLNHPDTQSTYPGEYTPAPLELDELLGELQKRHKEEPNPLINVAEMEDDFVIEAAAPGLSSADFFVSIEDNVLKIAVLKKDKKAGKKSYSRLEFNYSCFKREIVLPENIDAAFVNAAYKDGILYVRLPKSSEPVTNYVERIIVY